MAELGEREARMGLSALGLANDGELAESLNRLGAVETWVRLLVDPPTPQVARAREIDVEGMKSEAGFFQVRFVIPGDDEWPAQLDELAGITVAGSTWGVPFGLWLQGAPLQLRDAVAVTGARASTSYGDRVAEALGCDLAESGRTVVTGLALGNDVAAARGALSAEVGPRVVTYEPGLHPQAMAVSDAPASPVVVLAHGHAHTRLSGHEDVIRAIDANGTMLSEHPPFTHPSRARLLARARLIAALSRAAVIVEGANRSGARAVASWAQELDRVLMAVPGPVTSCVSYLPHALLQEGRAQVATCTQDVIDALQVATITYPREDVPNHE